MKKENGEYTVRDVVEMYKKMNTYPLIEKRIREGGNVEGVLAVDLMLRQLVDDDFRNAFLSVATDLMIEAIETQIKDDVLGVTDSDIDDVLKSAEGFLKGKKEE